MLLTSTPPDLEKKHVEVEEKVSFSLLWLVMAAAIFIFTAATVVPFLTDLAGFGTNPEGALAAGLAGLLLLLGWAVWEGWKVWRRKARIDLEMGGLIIVGLAFLTTFGYSLNQAAPFDNLPMGITADSTHHYALSDYIETHHTLPTRAAPADAARLVEMTAYPPAFHLSAALYSETTHTDLAYTIFPLAAFFMALCSAITAALAYTLLKPTFLRPFLALLAAYLAYLAYGFCFETFMYWDFYGQLAGQVALAFGLYFALHFFKTGYWPSLLLGLLAGSVLTLAYTHWLPILGFGLVAAVLLRPGLGRWVRLITLGISGLALFAGLGLFLKDRLGGVIVWSGGAGANIAIEGSGLGWLGLGIAGLSLLIWLVKGLFDRQEARFRLPGWLIPGSEMVAIGTFSFILFEIGSELAKVSPPHLYPFDNLTRWLCLGAGLGALVVISRREFVGRFYLVLVGGLVLEIAGYLLVAPGGSANAYHLSKLYTLGFGVILPPLVAPLLEAVFVDSPARVARYLKPHQPAAPRWLHWGAVLMGLFLAVVAFLVTSNQLLAHNPTRPRIAVDTAMVNITGQIRAAKIDQSQIELSVRPGIPAYFTYVGLLGQPRNGRAQDYYGGSSRHSFEDWLYNSQSLPYFLTDEFDAVLRDHPNENRFRVVYKAGLKHALLTRTPGFVQEMIERRALYMKFRGVLEPGVLTVNVVVAGGKSALWSLNPVLVVGPYQDNAAPLLSKPLFSREMSLAEFQGDYTFQQGYVKWRFADGYSRGQIDTHALSPEPFKLPDGKYSVWVQWWKDNQPVTQRKVQDFAVNGQEQTPLPPGNGDTAEIERTGQMLLEAPTVSPPALIDANTFFQQGDQKLLEITGWKAPATIQAGQTLHIWQRYVPVADLQTGYVIFVHLLDAKGTVVAQSDFEPGQGVYPTWLWPLNQPVTFDQAIKLPSGLATGKYSFEIGIYSQPDQRRLETWFYEPYLNRIWENRFFVKDAITVN